MQLTRKQEEGLREAVDRYRARQKYTVISGYAGSGKSTLVKFIVQALADYGIDPELDVAYCAFTGKAAQVLINKGNSNAVTAHKLMYEAYPKKDGTFSFRKKLMLEYKVVIVDECSMLPKSMADTLLSYPGVYVIFCGDPGQLPPINKTEDNHLLDHPHIFLDEVMRQAQDSGIIQLSMLIREGKNITGFKSNDAMILPKSALNTGMLEWGDQILCATNATRNALNMQCRQLKGYIKPVEEGEKCIVLANRWDTSSNKGNALTNGCTGILSEIFEQSWHYPSFMGIKGNQVPLITANFTTFEGDAFSNLSFDKKLLLEGEKTLTPQQEYRVRKNKRTAELVPYELAYGYAITTHKAQGSEWSKVLVVEERFPFDKQEHIQWLYTAITRASEKVVLIQGE